MSSVSSDISERSRLRQAALSRWDNEGGAIGTLAGTGVTGGVVPIEVPDLTNAELVHLRVRVIALENLVISMLVEASDRQLNCAREMAALVSPRPASTQYPLTHHAAEHMVDIVQRASRFRALATERKTC